MSVRLTELIVRLLCAVMLATGADRAQADRPAALREFDSGPYLYLPRDGDDGAASLAGHLEALRSARAAGTPVSLTLAFATGSCDQEHWAGRGSEQRLHGLIAQLRKAGVTYTIATGGQGASFACSRAADMEHFIRRHDSPQLRGLDFDIEEGQTAQEIRQLISTLIPAEQRHPGLRFRFTLPTFAANDGSAASLTTLGQTVLRAVQDAGLKHYEINLMVMDFGAARPEVCVSAAARCRMGESGIQAARNLATRYRIPWQHIAVTPMIGINDVRENVFTPEDAALLARFARGQGLAGLHWWSLDRDRSCPDNQALVDGHCHGLPDLAPYRFLQVFQAPTR